MIKRLSKLGDNLVLEIDRPILDLLGIDEQTLLELSTDGQSLVIAPVQATTRRERIASALMATNQQYGKALKRLAE